MSNPIEQVDLLAKSLKELLPMKPEDQTRLDKKIRLEFNYNSNHIEGNTLTYGETELLLIFDETKGNHTKREYDEMQAHDVAFQLVKEWATEKEKPLTEADIKNLNEIILVKPFWKDAITADGQPTRRLIKVGNYKEHSNSVRLENGEMFDYASPIDTPIEMEKLIGWYRDELQKKELHPVELAALLHYKFVRIHPFDDGNGRLSRLLMNYVLLLHDLQPVVIKTADKRNYISVLRQADVGDLEPLVTYIAENTADSLNMAIMAAKGESIEDSGDIDKEIELLKKRVANDNVPKSPIIVFNVFTYYNKELWDKLRTYLAKFNGLFNETTTTHYIDGIEEVKYRSSSFLAIAELHTKQPVENEKIFGRDIYDATLSAIRWSQTRYALRGAKNITNYEISLTLSPGQDSYQLKLTIQGVKVFEVSKPYNDLLLSSDIDGLIQDAGKTMLQLTYKDLGTQQ